MAAPIKLSHPETKGFWEIPVLYEDEFLLALAKPADLFTTPEAGSATTPDLLGLMHVAIRGKKAWALERTVSFLRNVHRLDFGVSGVLVFAKSQEACTNLANAFGSDQPIRRYLAIAQGVPEEDKFGMDAKLAPHPEEPGLIRVDSRFGKKSKTSFEVLERFSGWSLLACEPHPDRPHQVRVHLRYKRLPLVGDPIYRGGNLRLSAIKPGFRLKPNATERPLMVRPALHLETLSFRHPVSGTELKITAPLPKDICVALKYLRKYAADLGDPRRESRDQAAAAE